MGKHAGSAKNTVPAFLRHSPVDPPFLGTSIGHVYWFNGCSCPCPINIVSSHHLSFPLISSTQAVKLQHALLLMADPFLRPYSIQISKVNTRNLIRNDLIPLVCEFSGSISVDLTDFCRMSKGPSIDVCSKDTLFAPSKICLGQGPSRSCTRFLIICILRSAFTFTSLSITSTLKAVQGK